MGSSLSNEQKDLIKTSLHPLSFLVIKNSSLKHTKKNFHISFLIGPNSRKVCGVVRVPVHSGVRGHPRHRHQPGVPLGQGQGLPVHHPVAADPGRYPGVPRQSPHQDHHRGRRPREGLRGRPQHPVHLRVEQAQRI